MRWFVPAVWFVLAWAASASAGEGSTVGAAARAQAAHELACPDVAAGDQQAAPGSIRRAAEAWEEVSAAYAAEPQPFLLYWRGLLAECLSRPELASQDLAAFVQVADADSSLATMVAEARRRLDRMARADRRPRAPDPPLVAGAALAIGAGAAGLLALPQFVQVTSIEADLLGRSDRERAEIDSMLADGDAWLGGGIATVGAAVGLGVAAAIALGSAGRTSPKGRPVASVSWGMASGRGFALGLAGRW